MRRVISLSLLCLTFFATSAAAESAWVLWWRTITPIEDWDLLGAHPTVQECSQDLVALAQSMKKDGYDMPGALPGVRTITYKKGDKSGRLMCLPDTVDPRGVKK